ncbi:hypothetical protein D9M68_744900 [compost metagenome]
MQAHVVPVEAVGKSQLFAVRQGVVTRHDQHQLVLPVGAGLQVGRGGAHPRVADAQIGRAFLHGPNHLAGQVFLQVDLDLVVQAGEAAQVLGQELDDGRDVGMHAHMITHTVGVLRKFALHLVQAEQHRARVVEQALAGGRGSGASGMAVKQRGAHGAFKIGKALAHGRGGHEFLLGRLADAAALAHRHKELERGEVEAAGKAAVRGVHG